MLPRWLRPSWWLQPQQWLTRLGKPGHYRRINPYHWVLVWRALRYRGTLDELRGKKIAKEMEDFSPPNWHQEQVDHYIADADLQRNRATKAEGALGSEKELREAAWTRTRALAAALQPFADAGKALIVEEDRLDKFNVAGVILSRHDFTYAYDVLEKE